MLIVRPLEAKQLLRVALRDGLGASMRADSAMVPMALVLLERSAFLAAWSRCLDREQRTLARQDEAAWRRDGNFHRADSAFAACATSPISVADVVLSRDDRGARVALTFNDGVTRTLWLLAHGAAVLPFRCDDEDAEQIDRLAGTDRAYAARFVDLIA